MDKFQNKYRIPSARLQNWNDGSPGLYFINVCTANRKHYFGEISNAEMISNELGSLVRSEWIKTLDMRADMNLELGEFVVMPNHFHGIIIIGENEFTLETRCIASLQLYKRRSAMFKNYFKIGFGNFRRHKGVAFLYVFLRIRCQAIKAAIVNPVKSLRAE